MDKEMPRTDEYAGWRKAISRQRDRTQARLLVRVMTPLLVCGAVAVYLPSVRQAPEFPLRAVLFPFLFSFGFAALVWTAGSATLPAAGVGLLICLILAHVREPATVFGMVPALSVLFLLTFAATRFGRAAKERRGLAEARSGRRASQIVANLGAAALCASMGWKIGCIAALAEAAADTVSSETGQALGGRAWLITTFRRVPAGEDGGMSVAGTGAGVVAAALVVWAGGLPEAFWPMFAAACAGLVFDSMLGATVEKRGWIGNDLVNFASTLFAAAVAQIWMMPW